MKKILFSVMILCLCWSCKEGEKSIEIVEAPVSSIESFDWMLGEWERANEQEGKETFESWEKISETEYAGFGFTKQSSDTIWQENITLIKRDTVWHFEVTGYEEDKPTVFRITNIEESGFISENPDNEFPKIISYSRDGNKLQAVISGEGMEIPFEFVPKNSRAID